MACGVRMSAFVTSDTRGPGLRRRPRRMKQTRILVLPALTGTRIY